MFAIGRFPFCPKPTLPVAPEMGRVAWKSDLCLRALFRLAEIPLIMNDANSPLPTLDSTRLLARAALRRAVAVYQ